MGFNNLMLLRDPEEIGIFTIILENEKGDSNRNPPLSWQQQKKLFDFITQLFGYVKEDFNPVWGPLI